MFEQFHFETFDIEVETTQAVRDRVSAGQGAVVLGKPGVGKTHAVRKALPEAAFVQVREGPLQQASLMVDLARQLNGQGRAVLKAFAAGNVEGAFAAVNAGLGGRPLVVDGAERLYSRSSQQLAAQGEDFSALWAESSETTRAWLQKRVQASPTVVVSRESLWSDDGFVYRHQHPWNQWTIKLRSTPDGYRDWPTLAQRIGSRPAGLVLARAFVPLVDPYEYHAVLDELPQEGHHASDHALADLARFFVGFAPPTWRKLLALCRATEGVRLADLVAELDEFEERPVFMSLVENGLVTRIDDRVGLLPILNSVIAPDEASPGLLRRIARRLMAGVNQPDSLDAGEAERVFRAHALYVEVGDFDAAARLAKLHLGGLVDLARRTSLAEQFGKAWGYYQSIRGLMPDGSSPRLRSYVIHYEAFNGRKEEILPLGQTLDGYTDACRLWPENALWHRRRISTLIEQTRLSDAREALDVAYQQVPEHPLRDEVLRFGPAWAALKHGVGDFGLSLLGSVLFEVDHLSPAGREQRQALLDRWSRGVLHSTLRHDGGQVLFNEQVRISTGLLGRHWVADLEGERDLRQSAEEGPAEAVRKLANGLVERIRWLLQARMVEMNEEDHRQKSRLISRVDLLNSDLGYQWSTQRWLLGSVQDGWFVPVNDFEPIEIAPGVQPDEASPPGLWAGRVPTFKDGHPRGAVERLERAGSGRSLGELIEYLRSMETADDDA